MTCTQNSISFYLSFFCHPPFHLAKQGTIHTKCIHFSQPFCKTQTLYRAVKEGISSVLKYPQDKPTKKTIKNFNDVHCIQYDTKQLQIYM